MSREGRGRGGIIILGKSIILETLAVFVCFLGVRPKVARIIDFLKVIIRGPRLADQGWSGPRGDDNFKKIDNPGNLATWPFLSSF